MSKSDNEKEQFISSSELPEHVVEFMSDVAEIIEQVGNGYKNMLKGYEELLKLYINHNLKG